MTLIFITHLAILHTNLFLRSYTLSLCFADKAINNEVVSDSEIDVWTSNKGNNISILCNILLRIYQF